MSSFTFDNRGRFVVMHVDRGGLLLESIEQEMQNLGIKNAILLSCIGTLCKAVYHYINTVGDYPQDEFRTLEGPMELGCMQGMVLDGQAHFHMVISDLNQVYTGHLEPGSEVQNLMEIALLEMPEMELTRRKNQFGIAYIDRK